MPLLCSPAALAVAVHDSVTPGVRAELQPSDTCCWPPREQRTAGASRGSSVMLLLCISALISACKLAICTSHASRSGQLRWDRRSALACHTTTISTNQTALQARLSSSCVPATLQWPAVASLRLCHASMHPACAVQDCCHCTTCKLCPVLVTPTNTCYLCPATHRCSWQHHSVQECAGGCQDLHPAATD
jgi:hypothetical protein